MSQHPGRVLASSQRGVERVLQGVLPLCLPHPLRQVGFTGEHVASRPLLISSPCSWRHSLPSQPLVPVTVPLQSPFFAAQESPGHVPRPIPHMILHHLHHSPSLPASPSALHCRSRSPKAESQQELPGPLGSWLLTLSLFIPLGEPKKPRELPLSAGALPSRWPRSTQRRKNPSFFLLWLNWGIGGCWF